MTIESLLMQYQSECLKALKSTANIRKPFENVFMDAMKLFMAIPDRINFLQMGRYGKFSEQTYRNHFEDESFDWFSFNEHLFKEHLTGTRKAIAIDPSYIPKSGKKTPWLGYFWSALPSGIPMKTGPTNGSSTSRQTGRGRQPMSLITTGRVSIWNSVSETASSQPVFAPHDKDPGCCPGLCAGCTLFAKLISKQSWQNNHVNSSNSR